jgi:acetolactate synthase-1/2/3 large subunit
MLAVGTRFAEICTGSYGAIPPENLVHIDINPGALGRNYPTPVPVLADARDAVPALAQRLLESGVARDGKAAATCRRPTSTAWGTAYPAVLEQSSPGPSGR